MTPPENGLRKDVQVLDIFIVFQTVHASDVLFLEMLIMKWNLTSLLVQNLAKH